MFLAFSQVVFQAEYLLIVGIMFAACVGGLILGRLINNWAGVSSPFFPFLMTGFEAGMMGYAIYGAVYGAENIYKFGVIDLGQVTFVFFVLVPLLERRSSGAKPISHTLISFLRTPVILAILLGIVVNQTGIILSLRANPFGEGILKALEYLGNLTTPLIALVIGYEMHIKLNAVMRPLRTIAIRYALWFIFGIFLNSVVLQGILKLDASFQAAVMTMMVLPPPFVIPIFMKKESIEENEYVVNTLSLATLVTLFAFSLVTVVYHP